MLHPLLLQALALLPPASGAAIDLPGVEGRIDHLAVDLARQRLFLAALGNDSVEVVDLEAGRRVQSLRGTREPQGILYLADADRLVVASGRDGTCDVYDGDTLEKLASVPLGDDADNLRYDAPRKRVYVAYGQALGIVDATTWKVAGKVPLDGHPEGFQLDPGGARAFVNVPGAQAVVVIDLEARRVVGRWKLDGARSNFPMALVPGGPAADQAPLLALGCRRPARLVLRALPDGAPAGDLELSGDADDLFFDAPRRRVYAACGEGYLDVFDRAPSGLHRLTRLPTAAGARTCLFVPERDVVYVAVPHRGAQEAQVRILDLREGERP